MSTSADIEAALAAQRESIAQMLIAEANACNEIERASGQLRNCSAAGVFHEAARLVREPLTAARLGSDR